MWGDAKIPGIVKTFLMYLYKFETCTNTLNNISTIPGIFGSPHACVYIYIYIYIYI